MTIRLSMRLIACTSALTVALSAGKVHSQTVDQNAAQASDQTAPAETSAPFTTDEIVVTGTRISGASAPGSELLSVSQHEMVESGQLTTTQVLQQLPDIFNMGVTDASRSGTGGAGNHSYSTSINLRGISPFATLTLIDGQRAVPNGLTAQIVDPTVIPTIALDRVEIAADGGSAIYGSDAVVGVANLILRRNVEGIEAEAGYGWASEYNEYRAGLIGGHTWSGGQLTVAFEDASNSDLPGPSRSFEQSDLAPFGGTDFRVSQCAPGNVVVGGVSHAIPATGATPADLIAGTANKCDNIRNADILPAQKHYSVVSTFNQDLTESVSVSADVYGADRQYSRVFPAPALNLTVPNTNAFFVAPAGTAPTSETVQYSFANDYGPTWLEQGYSRSFDGNVGLLARLPDDWKFNADISYGYDRDHDTDASNLDTGLLTKALASSNPQTAFDPFGTTANSAALLASLRDQVAVTSSDTKLVAGSFKFDGPLFQLPTGTVKGAAGTEYLYNQYDPRSLKGADTDPTLLARNLERSVISVFAEVLVPVVSADMGIPGIQSITLDAAGRYDHYNDVGSTSNPKVGVDWRVTDDLKLRGSYGTSFRAPSLSQIATVQGNQIYLQNYSDPLANNGAGGITQGATLSGGNPGLKPETATTYSAGFDFTPKFLPDFQASLTYFNIDYRGQITSELANLNVFQLPGTYSAIAFRRPSTTAGSAAFTATLQTLLNEHLIVNGGSAANVLADNIYVDGRYYNLGVTQTQGLDFTAGYRIGATPIGRFSVGLVGTYFLDYRQAVTPTAPVISTLNTINNPDSIRLRGNVGWEFQNWDTALFVNYEGGYTNNLVTPNQSISSYTTVDLHLAYDFGSMWALSHASISLDATNLLNATPPFVNIAPSTNAPGGFDPTMANPIGRLLSTTLRAKM